jgi:hypothetical protein
MPLAPLLLEALTPTPEPVQSIFLAGADVNNQPGALGNGYYVPIGSIEVDEQGPGGVSKLSFDLVDPLGVGPVPHDGDEVQYWNNLTNAPVFAGFVSNWATRVLPNSQGRVTAIDCVGYEVLLDWAMILDDLTIPAFTTVRTAAQTLVAVAEGTRGIRAFASGPGPSSQAFPTSIAVSYQTQYAITIAAGTSLREALSQVITASRATISAFGDSISGAGLKVTVDFYKGLRICHDLSSVDTWAVDYTPLTVADTLAGVLVASALEHETDATQIVRGVFIKGANAAGTGFLGDGSGKPGRIAYLEDPSIDTAAKLLDAQATHLSDLVVSFRGSFDLVDWAPTAGVRPGSVLTLTDAQANATGTYRIYQLTKRFLKSGRETWTVTYGGLRPSATRLIRRLTRATRS